MLVWLAEHLVKYYSGVPRLLKWDSGPSLRTT
jgi:hypothetical protein